MINLKLVRLYLVPRDWAGIGRNHLMVAWDGRGGIPRSLVLCA